MTEIFLFVKFRRIIADITAGTHVYVEDLHNFEVWLASIKMKVNLESFHFSKERSHFILKYPPTHTLTEGTLVRFSF